MAFTATTITMIGLTIPALTAASPTTRPPTIPIVCPIGPGNRIPPHAIFPMQIPLLMLQVLPKRYTFTGCSD